MMLRLLLNVLLPFSHAAQPNFVYFLLDDMAKMLGDEEALPQTRALLGDRGTYLEEFRVSSPKCTPSRSAFLTGRYYHK